MKSKLYQEPLVQQNFYLNETNIYFFQVPLKKRVGFGTFHQTVIYDVIVRCDVITRSLPAPIPPVRTVCEEARVTEA